MGTVVARRKSGYEHSLHIDDDHELVIDEPEADGGTDKGPAPTRLLAGSLAGCTAVTMEMYAGRKGWDLDDLAVAVEADGTLVGGDLTYDVVIDLPAGLDSDQRERLLKIAAKCPVHKALSSTVPITIRAGSLPS